MEPVYQFECEGARAVIFARNQPGLEPLPALIFQDGTVLTEWSFSEDDRARIARGENLRLWIWTGGHLLQPVAIEITDEHQG